jgi:hypothetical protein
VPAATPAVPGATPRDPGRSPLLTPGSVLPATATPAANTPATTIAVVTASPSGAALTVVAILENVRGAGAPPAWSADGSALAFSAMPADGSHGPDLYVWRPGEATARPVTSDHATYFGSWSGASIVASRVTIEPALDAESTPAVSASTVVVDPLTGAESEVDGPAMWLPQVNGPRSHAVAWRGRLELVGALVRPVGGELFVLDWRLLDPHAAGSPNDGAPSEPPTTDQPGTPDATATAEATDAGTLEPGPPMPGQLTLPPLPAPPSSGPPASPQSATPPASSSAQLPANPGASPTTASASPAASTPADPSGTPSRTLVLMPLEPGRDAVLQPVLDWEVRWAPDGTALGFWIADVPGASWGRLAVVAVDQQTGALSLGTPLLAPTLARRSFTLGHDRVAWVGPAEAAPDGQLRIVVWGPSGGGELRFNVPDLHGVLAAF